MAVQRVYDVAGMSCEHCRQAVMEAAKSVEGVKDVQVDLEKGKLTVTFAHSVKDDAIKEAVAAAGYTVSA